MRSIIVVAASLGGAVILFTLASLTGFQVEVAQPNGLAYIYFPYGGISFIASMAAFWFLILGVVLSLVALMRGAADMAGRTILGSGMVSSGVFAVVLAALWSLINLEDEGPRCIGGCDPSLFQYYQTVYVASTILAVLGVAAAVFGGLMVVKRKPAVFTPPAGASG